jgi:hypothetical protein
MNDGYGNCIAVFELQFANNVEYCWRLAKSTYQVSQIEGGRGSQEKKKQLVYASKDLSQKAVAMDDKCANAHKWCDILYTIFIM